LNLAFPSVINELVKEIFRHFTQTNDSPRKPYVPRRLTEKELAERVLGFFDEPGVIKVHFPDKPTATVVSIDLKSNPEE
jgi:hypothetical protein